MSIFNAVKVPDRILLVAIICVCMYIDRYCTCKMGVFVMYPYVWALKELKKEINEKLL